MIYKRGNHWHMDAMVNGVRYREGLHTTDKREAAMLEKTRIAEIHQGKGASLAGREFGRRPFREASDVYLDERKPHVSERTAQLERERLVHLKRYFGEMPVLRIKAEDVSRFQKTRLAAAISNRTVNMEIGVLRRILKRAKKWTALAEDVRMLPENTEIKGRVLASEHKRLLFHTASGNEDWAAAFCAAVLAVSTTCRGVELKHLRWRDVDLFSPEMHVRRSKTAAGRRSIPLNSDALAALSRLRIRAGILGTDSPDQYVFPACENGHIDGTRPQKSWRTAWRALVREAGKRSDDPQAFHGLRFHDLRHQAITELAENGASDATLMSLAGHMSRRMLEHYSHVRRAVKREALAKLEGDLMSLPVAESASQVPAVNE